jgi:hypothetical protein
LESLFVNIPAISSISPQVYVAPILPVAPKPTPEPAVPPLSFPTKSAAPAAAKPAGMGSLVDIRV